MRIIEVIADTGYMDTLIGIAGQYGVTDHWYGSEGENGRRVLRMLVNDESRQVVLDTLVSALGSSDTARIIIMPVEASLPRRNDEPDTEKKKTASSKQTREELYEQIEKGARLDSNFLLLVCLSTVVAVIGLLEDNVAVIVGAMVIAPLLGPNISLAFATSLGDRDLIWRSLKTNLAGLSLTLVMAIAIGAIWPGSLGSHEILLRTDVGLDGAVLALASGAAAVLSLSTGIASALVGVMVAVALLPPAATLGMLIGNGQPGLAMGAGLLLAVNVVCLNLSAKLMFMFKGIKPRTWLEKRQARQSALLYILVWAITLGILLMAIYLRHRLQA